MKLGKRISDFLRDSLVVLLAFAAMGLLATLALNMSFFNPVAQTMKDFSLTDVYYYVMQDHGRIDTSRVVTIVDMTELQSRAEIGDVLAEIESMNPKVVGIDAVFEVRKPDTLADRRLTELAAMNDNMVFSCRLQDFVNDTIGYSEAIHSFFTEDVEVREGVTNYSRSLYGGVKRSAPIRALCQGEKLNSFVYEVAQLYSDGNLAEHKVDMLNINFRPTFFRKVSPDSLALHPEWIEGQVVLFGATHDLADMHYTPLGQMSGVELLAYSVQTFLEQTEVRHPSAPVTAVVSFLLVLLTYRGRKAYVDWAKARKNEWVSFFLTTTFVVGFLLFLWTATLVWCGFILFILTGLSFSFGWTMAAIPFLGGAGEFYGITIKRCMGGFTLF